MLSTKVKFEQSTPRYRYEKTKDENGNGTLTTTMVPGQTVPFLNVGQ